MEKSDTNQAFFITDVEKCLQYYSVLKLRMEMNHSSYLIHQILLDDP